MNEQILDKAKSVTGLMTNYEQSHLEDKKTVKIPAKFGDSLAHHKQGPSDLLKELLNRQIFQEAPENDQDIKNQIAQLSSGVNSDSNMIKLEVQTLVKYLVDINSEIKNPQVDLGKIKDDLKSLSQQAKEMSNIETVVVILKSHESRSEEIVTMCKDMAAQVGEKTFESSLQKLVDLVMNLSKDLKKETKTAEEYVDEMKDSYQPISKGYQDLSELVGMAW